MVYALSPANGAGFCIGGRTVHHDLRDERSI